MESVGKSTISSKHKMTWAVAGDGIYLVRCDCGWSEMTFADTPGSSIGSVYERHLL